MAIQKKKELKQMNKESLKSNLDELKKELMKLNTRRATGSLDNPGKIKQIKKTIARILTLLNQKSENKEVRKNNE